MAQVTWVYLDDYGGRHRVGLYHGDHSGHLMIHINRRVVQIDFSVRESRTYAIGFNNSYSCASNINWVTTNNVTSIPMDSGATQVAYYGGMGMPTIVILGGGTNHSVLGSPYVGFATSDTITMAADIRNFLNTTTGITASALTANTFDVYPNPANGLLNFRCNLSAHADLSLQIMDLTGKTLMTVNEKNVAAGEFTLPLNTAELTAGTYLIKATANDAVLTKRFTVTH